MTYSLSPDVELALVDVVETGEALLGAVTTLAGTLVLTDRQVVIVRQGRAYRPQNGIRSWRISEAVKFDFDPPRGGMGRLMLGNGKDAISFFVKDADWAEALRLVTVARTIAHRSAVAQRDADMRRRAGAYLSLRPA
jgi:hypothetical protein